MKNTNTDTMHARAVAILLDKLATTTPLGDDDTGTFTAAGAYLLSEKHGLLDFSHHGSRPLAAMANLLDRHACELLVASDGHRYYYTVKRGANISYTLHRFKPLP